MRLVQIYECLCDETRLRIVGLLIKGPLCVCHIQDIIDESQVNVSRHLAYLKKKGLVERQRHHNWMIYHLPPKPSPELESNLKCLQDCLHADPIFKKDLVKLQKILGSKETRELLANVCC